MIQFIFRHNIHIMPAHEIKYSQHIRNIINHNVYKLNFFVMKNTISLTAIIPYCSTSSHMKLRRRKRMTRRCGYLRFRSRVRIFYLKAKYERDQSSRHKCPPCRKWGISGQKETLNLVGHFISFKFSREWEKFHPIKVV